MSYLSLDAVSVTLGQFHLCHLCLTLERGEILVVLGPSGAGKSVLVETIAGFHQLEAGRIVLEGRDLTSLPPEQRGLGVLFQDYALFPHRTVEQNVRFGVRRQPDATARMADALQRVGATHLRQRQPATLSGGEQQRVALARALAIRPRLLLLDEPLAALDASTREALRDDLRTLLRSIGTASLYVTHDRTEALVLGQRLAILAEGAVRQIGTPEEVFARPRDGWVAAFVGMQTWTVDGAQPVSPTQAEVSIAGHLLRATITGWKPALASGCLAARPEDIEVRRRPRGAPAQPEGLVPAVVREIVPLGALVRVDLEGALPARALLTRREREALTLQPADEVLLHLPADKVLLLPPD